MMKRCPACGETKSIEEFAIATRRKDGRQGTCKPCKREMDRRLYRQDPTKYAVRRNRRRTEIRDQFIAYLRAHECVDCGEKDILVLEFDHVSDDKVDNISTMLMRGMTWEKILVEIEKCEVVCANDHRRRTARRGSFYRWVVG